MPSNRLPRRVLYGELAEGGRSIGGQYKCYKDVVKNALKKCELDPAQLETVAMDRNKWRNACKTGVAHLQTQLDRAAEERRARRHAAALTAAAPDPALQCPTCSRQCRFLIGLFSNQCGLKGHIRTVRAVLK